MLVMFRLVGFAVLMSATSAFAESSIVDWSKPQTDDFRSVVDLRGDPNLRPQDGKPVRQVERPVSPSIQPQHAMAAANMGGAGADDASAPVYAQGAPRTDRPRVGVYLNLRDRSADAGGQALKDETAARPQKRSFRLGRRR
jgi:hypothetical protein